MQIQGEGHGILPEGCQSPEQQSTQKKAAVVSQFPPKQPPRQRVKDKKQPHQFIILRHTLHSSKWPVPTPVCMSLWKMAKLVVSLHWTNVDIQPKLPMHHKSKEGSSYKAVSTSCPWWNCKEGESSSQPSLAAWNSNRRVMKNYSIKSTLKQTSVLPSFDLHQVAKSFESFLCFPHFLFYLQRIETQVEPHRHISELSAT